MTPPLEDALKLVGLPYEVESRERLAVLVPRDADVGSLPLDRSRRQEIVALARAHGFTHVAVEIRAPGRAALSGDQSR